MSWRYNCMGMKMGPFQRRFKLFIWSVGLCWWWGCDHKGRQGWWLGSFPFSSSSSSSSSSFCDSITCGFASSISTFPHSAAGIRNRKITILCVNGSIGDRQTRNYVHSLEKSEPNYMLFTTTTLSIPSPTIISSTTSAFSTTILIYPRWRPCHFILRFHHLLAFTPFRSAGNRATRRLKLYLGVRGRLIWRMSCRRRTFASLLTLGRGGMFLDVRCGREMKDEH